MRFKRATISFVLAAALAACAGNSGSVIPPAPNPQQPGALTPSAASAFGDFDVTFKSAGQRHLTNVALSRKIDLAGKPWISIRGKGFDVQYKAGEVTAIASSGARTAFSGGVADLPVRTRDMALREFARYSAEHARSASGVNRSSCLNPNDWMCQPVCDASMPDCGICPDCTGGIPYPFEDFGMCYGNVTCGVNDSGVGTGILRNFVGQLACDFSLDSGFVDCFSNSNDTPLNSPADLFLGLRLTFTDAILTCANPVNRGYATMIYSDPNQHGAGIWLSVPVGPGQHQWDYPKQFIVVNGPPVTPTQPLIFGASYYKYGHPACRATTPARAVSSPERPSGAAKRASR